MEMIGLKFKIKNEYGSFLNKILNSINVLEYDWEIITDDTICPDDTRLFNDNVYLNGEDFLNCIMKDCYYMIFVDLKAFPLNGVHVEIETLNDFLESDCQLILLCTDSEFIEIYCKNKETLDIIYNNCKDFKFTSVEYLSQEDASNNNMIAF